MKPTVLKVIIKVSVALISLILIATFITNQCTPDYKKKDTKTVITTDSTLVDSLMNRISYLENLPPITVTDTLEIPVPVIQKDSSYTYSFPYRDSLLTANWIANTSTKVNFRQVTFDYILKRQRRVVKEKEIITLTKFRTKTITETYIENPKSYLTFGFETGTINNLSGTVGFMTKSRYHIRYRYNLDNDSHNLGISIPIKLF